MAAAMAIACAACANPNSSPSAGSGTAARSLPDMYSAIRALAGQFPAVASLDTLGYAGSPAHPAGDSSLPLLALELRAEGSRDATRPIAELMGAMHGDEQIGSEVALRLAQDICAAFEADDGSAAAALLSSVDLTVVPVANPWGYQADLRENCENVDLNRNFDWAWRYGEADTLKGSAPLSEPESAAFAKDAQAKLYDLAVTLHTGSFIVSLPWDYIATSSTQYNYNDTEYVNLYSPAQALFQPQGSAYAKRVGAVEGAGAFACSQGGDWYVVCGSYADWLYGTLGCPGYTVELAPYKDWTSQPAALGAQVIGAHEAALIGLLSSAVLGARGRVGDASGAAVSGAKVSATPVGSAAKGLPPPVPYTTFAYTGAGGYCFIALPAGEWELEASQGQLDSSPALAGVGSSGPSASVQLSL
jgi:predicted deacylase